MATIAKTVLRIVRGLEWWPKRPEKIGLDTEFHRDLGADGLELVELVMDLEDEFAVEIPEEQWLSWVTVRDAVQHLAGQQDVES
jgi:acyl carrier protein